MSTDLLFEQFATLATAPEGIAQLRELILQFAVQGKLGTQDPGDEPATVLLKEILKERHLLSNKKKSNVISSDEIPFEIPKNWIYTKIGDISQIIRGITYKKGDEEPYAKENYVPILRSNNINKGINFEKLVYLPRRFVDEQKWVKNGDLIVAMSSGSANLVGKTAQIENEFEGSIGAFCGIIRPTPLILKGYLKYFFQSPFYRSKVSEFGQGIGINNLGTNNLQSIFFPLPPLAEQHRIVAKVDRLMALCDELEARQQQERAGCLKLGTASLAGLQNAESPEEFGRQWAQVCDAFNLILDCPENVAVLRQTILQLAVLGKLGTQDPKDEPAEKIVERINRKVKPSSHNNEKKPFDLPNGWIWVKIETISNLSSGKSFKKSEYSNDGVRLLQITNVKYGKIIWDDLAFLPESYLSTYPELSLKKNDILMALNRPLSKGRLKAAKLASNDVPSILYQRVGRFDLALDEIRDFFLLYMHSPIFINWIENSMQGSDQPFVNKSHILNAWVPLPPLAEQHRIVAKVDALMALFDALETRLKERAGVQGKMAGAVVKNIAGSVQ